MKNLLLDNALVELWKEAETPVDYIFAFWISGLATLAVTTWLYLVANFIMNPSMFNNVTWGLIDYI